MISRLLAALMGLFLSPVAGGAVPRPYVAPWLAVSSSDPRIARIAALPVAEHSPNAPGLLLRVDAAALPGGRAAVVAAARELAEHAHGAGWKWGLKLSLPDAAVPADVRAAEAATVEDLWPGLGEILGSARNSDLITIAFAAPAGGDLKARAYLLRKVAAGVRAAASLARIVFTAARNAPAELVAPADLSLLSSEENSAYLDFVGVTPSGSSDPGAIRAAIDSFAFGKPGLVDLGSSGVPTPGALLAVAARFAPENIPFVVVSPAWPAAEDATLERFARVVAGDFGPDTRAASAASPDGTPRDAYRVVSGLDLGGVVLLPGTQDGAPAPSGAVVLTLDATPYASAEILELATGASKRLEMPASAAPARLTLSLAKGPLALRLTAREKAPAEAPKAAVGVAAVRGITADEILARHQAWRAARDARWKTLSATNTLSMRFRFANLGNTLDLTLAGPFFYEKGGGFDWAWHDAYFNGVRWTARKLPELPLLQPEKVADMPLALTLDDTYRYTLVGEDAVRGISCWALDFEPRVAATDKPAYAGRVWIARDGFAAVRVRTRQLNLTAELQAVDETADFTDVPAPDGGPPLRLPTRTTGQWILKTFSRTTVIERESVLTDIRLDDPSFLAAREETFASKDTMVRDTEKGVRYLEKAKDGTRVVTDDSKHGRLFGLGGLFYDGSYDYPLPLLGIYWIDLDASKRHDQFQVLFGGVLLAASWSQPRLLGSPVDVGVDVFGIAIRGTDALYASGEEDKTQRVKGRSFAAAFKAGIPLARHLKFTATVTEAHRDFAADDVETSPAFVIPSNTWITRLEGQLVWDWRGWALTGRVAWNKRSQWDPWGFPGNPDYDPGKNAFTTWSGELQKDFHLPRFQRVRASVGYLGSDNTDRFSKYTFGFFGGTSLRGFRSGALRAEGAVTSKVAYGYVIGSVFRLEAIYEDARVKDAAAGLDWAYFSGAGLSGEFVGPWATLVKIDAGTPVAGRNRGMTGFVMSLNILKIF
ncbi:MAG: hypothetical protein PT977_04115 [Acidobacteriota bacterium]|nr:hypothetical protein [Acidobacteriota bacterium]